MYTEQSPKMISKEVREKAKAIASDLMAAGANAVILSGSAARGVEKPSDLDFLVFGYRTDITDELKRDLSSRYNIPVELFAVSELDVRDVIDYYKRKKEQFLLNLTTFTSSGKIDYQGKEGPEVGYAPIQRASWSLVPLLGSGEVDELLHYCHGGTQSQYVILGGRDFIRDLRHNFGNGEHEPDQENFLKRFFGKLHRRN